MASGVKRKHEEVENDGANSYHDQRQSILNISMVKLRTPAPTPRRGDTSLRRSVLIFNTLRHIETELQHEGVTLSNNKPLLPSLQPITDMELDLRPGSEGEMTPPLTPQPASPLSGNHSDARDDQERTLQRLETMEISTAPVTSPHYVTPTTHVTSQGSSIPLDSSSTCLLPGATPSECPTPLPPADTLLSDTKYILDSLLNCDKLTVASFASMFEVDSNSNSSLLPSLPTCQTTSTTSSSLTSPSYAPSNSITTTATFQGFNTQGSEFTDALTDLDLDFDLFLPFSSKLTPLSAEELMHTLPSGGDPFPGVTQNPSPCTHKNELLTDELDHVMQVLRVGGI